MAVSVSLRAVLDKLPIGTGGLPLRQILHFTFVGFAGSVRRYFVVEGLEALLACIYAAVLYQCITHAKPSLSVFM